MQITQHNYELTKTKSTKSSAGNNFIQVNKVGWGVNDFPVSQLLGDSSRWLRKYGKLKYSICLLFVENLKL